MSLSEKLAKNIRRIRSEQKNENKNKHGWSQEKAAEACNLSDRAYRVLESGHGNPTLSTIEQICDGFSVTPKDLFYVKPKD